MKKTNRNFIVLSSLVGVLTFTSALLLALAPAPLTPDAADRLFAVETPNAMEVVFNTASPSTPGRWKYIYIHHTLTKTGNALSLAQDSAGLADHFLIGNGNGAVDGEIQISQRWQQQSAAAPPAGASDIDPACISITLVGDFDRSLPTPTQVSRLGQLVSTLQARYRIPSNQVILLNQKNVPAGLGQYFPTTAFREQLIP